MLALLTVICVIDAVLLIVCGALAETQEFHRKHPPAARLGHR